jgi:nucleoside-diphosphate-sugar epimerase
MLVTGAAGFIGSHLAEALCADGHEVIGIDSLNPYYDIDLKRGNLRAIEHGRFESLEADLMDVDLAPLLDGVSRVFHLAGQPGVRGSWRDGFDEYVRNNIAATRRLLDACVQAGVKRYVFASSSSVYGDAPSFPTSETCLPSPVSPYGVTKLAGEHLGNVYASGYGLSVGSVRFFTVYGPRQRPDMAIHRMISAARSGSEFHLFGDGSVRRDFTFVSDAVSALRTVGEVSDGGVYNVGGGSECAMLDLIELIADACGTAVSVVHDAPQSGDAARTMADTTRLRGLGWRPQIGLADGLAAQVAHLVQAGDP